MALFPVNAHQVEAKAEREKEHHFYLEDSQATSARPSGRNSVKVKMLW
jgi:hypothetical protein